MPSIKLPKDISRWAQAMAFARLMLLFILLTITLLIYLNLRDQEEKFSQAAFNSKVIDLEKTIRLRMKNYEEILLGVTGLYEASNSVERDEFRAYISSLKIKSNYVGVQGIGFSQWLAPEDVPNHIEAVRAEGFPDFKVRPITVRNPSSSILYIEPFEGRNVAVLGYDMYSETVRRTAMNDAVVNNTTSLSAKVILIQEEGTDIQPGMLMYHPVYKKNKPLETEAQRWAALEGFAYSPFRVNDLMSVIIKDRDGDINFQIYSSYSVVPDKKIYSSNKKITKYKPYFRQKRNVNLFGQMWTVVVTSTEQFDREHKTHFDQIVLVLGVISSFLLYLLLYAMSAQRQSSLLLEKSMSEDVHKKNRLLQQSEERFQLALESSAMGVWSWDLVNNVVQWDVSMHKLYGLEAVASLNGYDNFVRHLHPEDRERVFAEIAAALDSHEGHETEYRVIWSDSSVHDIAARAKITFDEHEVAVSMIGTCWDITERKRLETLKTEFVATVSHELRTPLTAITGALGLVVNGSLGDLSSKAQTALDIAYKNSQRLKLLINDLLDMDKLLAGKLEFYCEEQWLWPLIERAVTENQPYADQFNVRYMIEPVNPHYKINVEDVRFLQVMANFLSNAAKFSPENSEVVVSVTEVDGWLRISVTDKGEGIAPDAQLHIFEKFYQADSSNKRTKGGTGLGLAITKEIVERMQGRVGFVSEVGVGSMFYAEFQRIHNEE